MPLKDLIANAALKGAAIYPPQLPTPKMCNDCAFKKGTDANNEDCSVQAAADCLAFFGTFNCHGKPGENAGHVCAGFTYAKYYMEEIDKDDKFNSLTKNHK